ncbi:hypothetical protein ACFRAU_10170 [Arthrobacter sp. NPDC056691]|uniref:hypothetical protein n=1 Tax=Arthrobacter sp. NPDC056691 TaxID=3345913 RepID=UPI0036708CB3
MSQLHALVIYVPDSHAEAVLTAVGNAGAGRLGDYSHCSFRAPGTGRFTPSPGARPFIGTTGVPEEVSEVRIECIVEEDVLDAVVLGLRQAHPYEEPAFMSWPVNGHR